MNSILAIVVTYNRKTLLMECLEALLKQSMKQFDILIVDNASTDDTEQICKDYVEKYEHIIYQNTGANLGGAGGFQFGMKFGVKYGYDYFWIMDDDTVPETNALEALWLAHEQLDGNYGFLSSAALWQDGSLCKMNRPALDVYSQYKEYCLVEKGLLQIVRATFVSLFLKRNTVEEVGLPIKEFFIWCDDIEYTNRISKDYTGYFVADSKVLHKMKSNTGADISTDSAERVPRYYYEYRNCMYIARQNGMLWILYQIYRFVNNIARITRYSKEKKSLRYWIVLKGFWSGLWFFPKVEKVKYIHLDESEKVE